MEKTVFWLQLPEEFEGSCSPGTWNAEEQKLVREAVDKIGDEAFVDEIDSNGDC